MRTASLNLASPEVAYAAGVMERRGSENFSVAARVLSRGDRRHLLAVYGFARLADEIGDAHTGGRLAALDWLEGELDSAFAGKARDQLLRALQGTLAECRLPRAPLVALIEANRMDQSVRRYETWEQLEGYCALSAKPVGELVLRVFGLLTPARLALSDRVCTALQLVEHLQDLAEDVARGRLYIPAGDLARFGVTHEQLSELCARAGEEGEGRGVRVGVAAQSHDSDGVRGAVRETVRFETARVRELLGAGAPLVGSVPGRAKFAVAGFVAGGVAAAEAIERADYEVLGGAPLAGRVARAWALGRVLAESRR
jgi:squalene synthase HpnC